MGPNQTPYFAIWLLACALKPGAAQAKPGVATQAKVVAPAAKIEQLSREQFRALSGTAQVVYRGKTMTKDKFIGQRLQEFRSKLIKLKDASQASRATIESEMVKFTRQQDAKLAAANGKVQEEWEGLQREVKRLSESAV